MRSWSAANLFKHCKPHTTLYRSTLLTLRKVFEYIALLSLLSFSPLINGIVSVFILARIPCSLTQRENRRTDEDSGETMPEVSECERYQR